MRVFYAFRDIVNGLPTSIRQSNTEPIREEQPNGDVYFKRNPEAHDAHWPFVQTDPMALEGLGVEPKDHPGPGECKKLSITAAGDPGTSQAYLDSMHEKA